MHNVSKKCLHFSLLRKKCYKMPKYFSAIPCHPVGTLFQVQNMLNNGSSDRLSIQVIGRQRCRLMSPLKRHQIHCEDSYVLICDLIEVVVLEERLLSSSLFTLNECCTFNKLRNDDKLKCKAALSAHTQFTLRQCSTGLTPFSFWVAANIPMSLETKLELLHEDCTDRRLQIEWRIVSQMDSMVCSKCANGICNVSDIVNLSVGSNSMHFVNPNGYVHDLFTVRRVRGIEFTGQPSAKFSWFPGYTWTVMACSNCEQHLDGYSIKDVHIAIERMGIFAPGDRIGVGVSGGKDSTVLAHVLSRLNARHGYGLKLVLLCVDEGIKGYRDDSIREVQKNEADLHIPLTITSYRELYGWTMDEIVAKIGRKNNCTFCGVVHLIVFELNRPFLVFRRQALDRAALHAACNKLATGHNADDAAETVLMNFLRGDVGRLQRMGAAAAAHQTGGKQRWHSSLPERNEDESLPRVKPLKYSYEKDIVIYSHFGKLNYFSTECVYAPNAYRSNVRSFVKELERIRPRAILDLVFSGESLRLKAHVSQPKLGRCERCGYIASQKLCKACQLLEGLNENNGTTETEPQKEEGSPAANDRALKLDGEAMSLESCGRMECGCNTAEKLFDF
uniref:CULT domain-containing protein n=2 Tax=Globodera pallida TaxID=36090 RepID=A0A183CL82_GLOPA